MPAPKLLAALPKPVLFGLYGAVGGLLGALVFGELLWYLLRPPVATAAVPEPRVAVAAAKDVEVFVDGRNALPVQVARGDFTGPVTVRLDDLPQGVTAAAVTIPADRTEGEVIVLGGRGASAVTKPVRLVAEASAGGKTATADAVINLKVWNPPKPQADIVFVLDVTSSMQWAIDDLKNGIGKFGDALAKARIDYRLALVTFRDVAVPGEKVEVAEFRPGEAFTADEAVFREKVGTFVASGGGADVPESSLEAVAEATKLPLRKSATKVVLLITDAPPKVADPGGRHSDAAIPPAVQRAAQLVRAAEIDSVHLVVQRFDEDDYRPLMLAGAEKAGGRTFNLADVVRGDEGFDPILATFGTAVTEAARAKVPDSRPLVPARGDAPVLGVKSLQSGEQSAAGSEGKVVLRSGVWAGAIAALVCLALLAGQHHYLRGTLPALGGVLAGLLGGLVVGFIGGAAGQGLYLFAPQGSVLGLVLQVLGWTLLGGLAGAGLSPFIPNLRWTLGLAGGAIGGAAGAAGYLAVSVAGGEVAGRLAGGLLLGFCIGLMVAVVEAAFRRAWLEVRFGARETITVTLGPEPVKIGGDAKLCTVWARGAAPLALRFFVRDGSVVCDDAVMKRETAAADGFSKEVGNVTVTVRTGTNATATTPPAPRPTAPVRPEPARPKPADDEYDALPMPVSPPPPAPAKEPPKPPSPPVPQAGGIAPPARPKPVPAAPPKPAAPVAAPPPKPAAPAAPKSPDACPTCGRVNPGKPKQRYCMVCDNTY
jgi:hypothetical protein